MKTKPKTLAHLSTQAFQRKGEQKHAFIKPVRPAG